VPGGGGLHPRRRRHADVPGYNEVYKEFFAEPYPARTSVGAALPPGVLVEIEAVARRDK
jgi:enamine deaminase RidA (YjgF/YER057c/UK114 family)